MPEDIKVGMDKQTLERVYSQDLRRWLIDQGMIYAKTGLTLKVCPFQVA